MYIERALELNLRILGYLPYKPEGVDVPRVGSATTLLGNYARPPKAAEHQLRENWYKV